MAKAKTKKESFPINFIQHRLQIKTVSCYALHPLASRFVRLRRRVHLVSEWLVSTVCCPCCDAMALSSSISCYTKPSELLEAVQKPTIDPGRASGEPLRPQHLTIDFTPGVEDSRAVENKCHQFWEFVANESRLDNMVVQPDKDIEPLIETITIKSSCRSTQDCPTDVENRDHFPAIHSVRKMEARGAVKAALNSRV